MKKYDIKTTDKETLRKWFYLMTLGRAIDEKAPSYLLQSLGWSYRAPYATPAISYRERRHTDAADGKKDAVSGCHSTKPGTLSMKKR